MRRLVIASRILTTSIYVVIVVAGLVAIESVPAQAPVRLQSDRKCVAEDADLYQRVSAIEQDIRVGVVLGFVLALLTAIQILHGGGFEVFSRGNKRDGRAVP